MQAGRIIAGLTLTGLLACQAHVETAHVSTPAPPPPPPRAELVREEPEPPIEPMIVEGRAPACPVIAEDKLASPPALSDLVPSPVPPIEDPAGVMAPFYARVVELARGTAKDHVRIAVYGDSNMTRDYVTGQMRRLFQERFGDAGHGFVALGRPWPWYMHVDVQHDLRPYKGWRFFATSTHKTKDGLYGFANIAAESSTKDATSWVATARDGAPVGTKAERFDVYYLKAPGGGAFEIRADGALVRSVETRASKTAAGFESFDLADAPHRIECVAQGNGKVRLFGVTLERKAPSVEVDSLGVGALNFEQMTHVDHPTRREMLAHRRYDLVVFLLGTNMFAPDMHAKWIRMVTDDFRAALPGTPILLMSPPDSGVTTRDWTSNPRIKRLAIQLREIAKDQELAYWDFFQAMGGTGSMKAFMQKKLAEKDCVHLTKEGGFAMGQRFVHAVFEETRAHAARHPDAGCPAPAVP